MNREKTFFDSIPIDLFFEIFSRLPANSVGRCRCVSKQWASLLGRQDFTELFLTRSSTRPRLLFALQRPNGEWLFYSSPHPQKNTSENSIVLAVDFHTEFHKARSNCRYSSGLFYFPDVWISEKKDEDPVRVICNPLTGQYAILPKLRTDIESESFYGFDPIDKQFKVLLINDIVKNETVHHILTLGAGTMRWRKILNCPSTHKPFGEESISKGICVNGVLYYKARTTSNQSYVIVCFDVRSEKFKFIDDDICFCKLINYKGKLGAIRFKYGKDYSTKSIELRTRELCVLEDVEKQDWSEYIYPFPENENRKRLSIVGITATGEFILSENLKSEPYVFYFSPEKNTLQRVQFQGVGVNLGELQLFGTVHAFVDHVEDLSVTDAKQLKSSIYDLRISELFESINKFDALCCLDDD